MTLRARSDKRKLEPELTPLAQSTPELPVVKRSDRIRLSNDKPNYKESRSLPLHSASTLLTKETPYVRSGLDTFKQNLQANTAPFKQLIESQQKQQVKRTSASNKRPIGIPLTELEEQNLSAKKLKISPNTPLRTPTELKGYFAAEWSIFYSKPWKGLSTSRPNKEERVANLLNLVGRLMFQDKRLVHPPLKGSKSPLFLDRNVRKGKAGRKKYQKKMREFAEKDRSIEYIPFKLDSVPISSKAAHNHSMVVREARHQPSHSFVSTPMLNSKMAMDEGKIRFLQRMVELTFGEREKAQVELIRAQEFARQADMEHSKAMKNLIDAQRRFEKQNRTF